MADLKISQFIDGGIVEITDDIAAVRSGENVRVQIGSAAALNADNSIGGLPLLENIGGNPALPPVDGSQVTGLLNGLVSTETGDTSGYLEDKILEGSLIDITKETDSSGDSILRINLRRSQATPASVSSGTHNANISSGDFHKITATGIFTLTATMAIAQSITIRAIAFDTFPPIMPSIDWGDAGVPVWTGKDDFIIYRDIDGDYIGSALVLGIT